MLLCSSIASFSQTEKTIGGDFRGKQCSGGTGFCGTLPNPDNRNVNSDMKNFKAIKTSATSMILELNTNMLTKDDQLLFFGKEYSQITTNETLTFVQQDDYEFNIDLLIYMGLDTRYKFLKKGEYPLAIVNDKVQVSLTLSTD